MSNVFSIKEAENKKDVLRVSSVPGVKKSKLSNNSNLGVSKQINCRAKEKCSFLDMVITYYVTSSLITIENNKKILVKKEGRISFNEADIATNKVTDEKLQKRIEQLKEDFKKELEKYQKFSFFK